VKSGAELNVKNNDDWAPIHIAARRGQCDAIRWALRKNWKLVDKENEVFEFDVKGGSFE